MKNKQLMFVLPANFIQCANLGNQLIVVKE